MPGPIESDIDEVGIPSIEGFDDEHDQDALDDDSPGEPEAPETVVRLDDDPSGDFGLNDEGEDVDEDEDDDDEDAQAAPVMPMDVEESAPKKKGGRPSKGATPAKTPAKTPKATTKTPRSTKSAATPASATASKKRKAELPAAEPAAKRGRGRVAATSAAAAIKDSSAKRARAPNGTVKAAPKTNGTRGRKKAIPAPPQPDEEEFEVESIVHSGVDPDTKEHMYYVKWLGYPDEDNTWEPKKNLAHASELIKEFEKSAKNDVVKASSAKAKATKTTKAAKTAKTTKTTKSTKAATTGTGRARGRPKKV